MPAWLIPLAISLGSTLVASKISSDAQKSAMRKRENKNAAFAAERSRLANERVTPLFNNLKVGGEDQINALKSEDVKNLKTFNDTEQNSEVKIGEGLNLGGKELAEFTNFKNDTNAKTIQRNNDRKNFHSQFVGINPALGKVGNEANTLALDRSKFADELFGKTIGDNLEVENIRPDGGMLALADAIRVAGMVASMGYGAGAGGASGSVSGGGSQLGSNAFTSGLGANAVNPGNLAIGAGGSITGAGAGGLGSAFAGSALQAGNWLSNPSFFDMSKFTNGASRGFSGAESLGYGAKTATPLTKYFNYAR